MLRTKRRGPREILGFKLYIRHYWKRVFGVSGALVAMLGIAWCTRCFAGCLASFTWGEMFGVMFGLVFAAVGAYTFYLASRKYLRDYQTVKHGQRVMARVVAINMDYKIFRNGEPTYQAMLVSSGRDASDGVDISDMDFGFFTSENLIYNPVEQFTDYNQVPVYIDMSVPDFERYFVDLGANIRI